MFKWQACTSGKSKSLSATKRTDPGGGEKKANFDRIQSNRAQTGVRLEGRTLPRHSRQCAACSFYTDGLKERQPRSTSEKLKPTSSYHHVCCSVLRVLCVTVRLAMHEPVSFSCSLLLLYFGGFPVLLQQLLTERGVHILSHIQVR